MSEHQEKQRRKGVLSGLKILLERNRLGELMVLSGHLSPRDLRRALERQRETSDHLGRVLINEKLVSRRTLYSMLARQTSLRLLAGVLTIFLGFSSLGIKNARAGTPIKDVPAQIVLANIANAAFAPIDGHYPALFGTEERRSGSLDPFTKWTSMFSRFDRSLHNPDGQKVIRQWRTDLEALKGESIATMAKKVNTMVNRHPYINDSRNWGRSDYWSTPIEFFTRGGDCEDFAIAKYASLRLLGVPEERLRIAIVHDKIKDMPHAILIVYAENGALVLDNQVKDALEADTVNRYKPIFSINRTAWWLHTAPERTLVAYSMQ
jgi:predicted transglutaminase-like cysteine proteinase